MARNTAQFWACIVVAVSFGWFEPRVQPSDPCGRRATGISNWQVQPSAVRENLCSVHAVAVAVQLGLSHFGLPLMLWANAHNLDFHLSPWNRHAFCGDRSDRLALFMRHRIPDFFWDANGIPLQSLAPITVVPSFTSVNRMGFLWIHDAIWC